MKSKLTDKPIEVWHLDEYVQCPNYAKYNWTNSEIRPDHFLYGPLRNVVIGCYKDLANLDKKVTWRTVRGRVHAQLAPLLNTDINLEDYKRIAISVLEQLRSWYLSSFREGPTSCLHNLYIESRVPATGVNIAGQLDAILLAPDHIRIVEVTNNFKTNREALNSLSLRAKVWMLHQQGIKVNQLQITRINKHSVTTDTLTIREYNDYIFKTERALQWATGSIKHQVFHPSITDMCTTCPYKEICSW